MGQRANGYMHAFDGRTLDMSVVFGAGFAGAPKGHVSVYRESSREELLRIARDGLTVPSPEVRHPEMRQEMELLDRYRPAHMVKKGVSRLGAIYAVPTPETPRLPFRKEYFVLEMLVDPTDSFVGDMDFITCLIPFIGATKQGLEKYRGAFQRYWESVIPLKDFLKHYRRVETGDGDHWVAKKEAPKGMPRTYFSAEILVMSQMISQRHMRVVKHEPTGHDHFEDGHEEVSWEGR
jgi:hypothetical protein